MESKNRVQVKSKECSISLSRFQFNIITHSLEDGGRGDAGAQEEAKVAEVVPCHEVVPFFVVLEGARNVS